MTSTMSVSLMFGVLLFVGEASFCIHEEADELGENSEAALSLLQTKAVKLQVNNDAAQDPSESGWLVRPGPCPTGETAVPSVQAKVPVVQPISTAQTAQVPTGDGDSEGYGDGGGDGDGAASSAPCDQSLSGLQPNGAPGGTCTPICTWSCISNPCEQTCEPICQQPQCQTRCGAASTLAGCAMSCNQPKCTTFCHKPCATQNCPWCTTKCGEPVCTMQCPESCHEVCNSPVCKWECKKPVVPAACAEPICELSCETPKCQTGGGFKDFPPLEPGEIVVSTFAAPAGTALTMTLLQEDGKNSKIATNKVEVEVLRVTSNLTLVHDRTVLLPVQA